MYLKFRIFYYILCISYDNKSDLSENFSFFLLYQFSDLYRHAG